MSTSLICIPIILFWIFKEKQKKITEQIICFSILYGILIYTYLQIDVPSNYYASRYFSLCIIPMVCLLMALIIKSLKSAMIIILFSAAVALPFNLFQMQTKAFDGQYNLYNDIAGFIQASDLVFIPEETSQLNAILTNNLRTINGNEVYNLKNHEEVENYYSNKCRYFIISEIPLNEPEYALVYEKTYDLAGNISSGGVAYPLENMPPSKCTCYLYVKGN